MEFFVIVTKKCHEIWWFQKKVVTLQPKVAKTFMTNNDFWKHIDTIIAQGFDAHGLKQLEEYAELF